MGEIVERAGEYQQIIGKKCVTVVQVRREGIDTKVNEDKGKEI